MNENNKVRVVSARITEDEYTRLMAIATESAHPGEDVKISVVVRDAVRHYLAARVS